MPVSGVVFRVGLVLVHLGAALGLLGAWSNAQVDPGGGANIGAGIAILAGTALLASGLLFELAALVVWMLGLSRRRSEPRSR